MDAISFELYKLSTIFTWRLYLSLIHIYTGPKRVSGLNMSAVCVRARVLQIIICLLKDSLIEIA